MWTSPQGMARVHLNIVAEIKTLQQEKKKKEKKREVKDRHKTDRVPKTDVAASMDTSR